MSAKEARRILDAERAAERLTYTVEEAALRLGIGKSLCWRLVASGDIPSIKLGTRRLVVRSALERLLERQETEQGERLRVMR